jgi:serine protease AprX
MYAKFRFIVILALVVTMFLGAGVSQAGPIAPQGSRPPLRLKIGTFTPGLGEQPAIPRGLTIAGYAATQRGYYIVQFRGPIEQAWKDQVTELGAELLDYVPDFGFKVRMTPSQARQVEQLSSVAWVGLFHPAFKLDPKLARDGRTHLYAVRVERGADLGLTRSAMANSGVQVLGDSGDKLVVAADSTQLDAIAQVLDVAWVEEFKLFHKHNEYGGGVIIGANTANANGYDGSSQIVAVADTGLGGGTASTAHRDIPASRIVAIYNWPGSAGGCFASITNDGAVDVDSGHGTHTSGSVLSSGDPNGVGRGVAPGASLVFQATENWATIASICKLLYGYTDGYYLTGLPSDLHQLFQQAYDAGARIHSNSWGASVAGDYDTDSAATDDFIWNHKDMVVTFSAGNDGIDANADGVTDSGSVGSPGTAKNVITVGASENDRQGNFQCDTSLSYTSHDAYETGQTCSSMGGNQVNYLGTWGQRYGSDFPAEPLKSDVTAGNAEQMAAWSSRGPVSDGRIKPDLVAPGTWVLSTFPDMYQEGYGDPVNPKNGAYQWDGWGMPYSSYYKYMGGTSMSNPLVAGAATVVRDYYQKAKSYAASAALVKATLINSAVDLLDENNDGVNDNDFPIPNIHEGWGRVNLVKATSGSASFVDNAVGLSTNGSASYQYTVAGGAPFKVTVVWTDYPSTDSASKNLVNDLNLTVTAPNGTTYRGNVFSGGWSQTGGSADNTNNVENVYIQSPGAGTWTVEVRGYNVPNGPQPFALVVDGGTPVTPQVPAAPSGLAAAAASSSQINLGWTDNANNEDGFKIERCTGSGCTNFAQIAAVGANATSYSDTGLTANTTYSYRIRAYNTGGDSAYSNTASATTPAASQPPAAPSGLTATAVSRSQINLGWTDNSSNEDGFKIERCTGSSCTNFTQIATVGANVTSYSNTGLSSGTYYRYRVRAYNAAGNSAYSNIARARTSR